MNDVDLNKAREFAEKLARQVGKFLLESKDRVEIKTWKDRQDIATNIDLEAEKMILEAIDKKYPTHSILSEEKGEIKKESLYTWLVDPIDGTKEYIRNLPFYNVSLALERNREIVLGIVFRPEENQLFSTAKGEGALFNQKRIAVSNQSDLGNAFIVTYLPPEKAKNYEEAWDMLKRLGKKCYRLRASSDFNASLCRVGIGAWEGFVCLGIGAGTKWWDVAAGLLFVEEAGGKVTDRLGKPIKNQNFSNGIVATNGKIHKQILKVLSK